MRCSKTKAQVLQRCDKFGTIYHPHYLNMRRTLISGCSDQSDNIISIPYKLINFNPKYYICESVLIKFKISTISDTWAIQNDHQYGNLNDQSTSSFFPLKLKRTTCFILKLRKGKSYKLRINKYKSSINKMFAIKRNSEQNISLKTEFSEYLCLKPPSNKIWFFLLWQKKRLKSYLIQITST